jgi:hypothetical protein
LLCQGIFISNHIVIWTYDDGSDGLPLLQYWSRLVISICLDPLNKHPAGNRYQHEASCRLLATDTWQGFLLYQNTGLGAIVGQMLECQCWVCGGWMCIICLGIKTFVCLISELLCALWMKCSVYILWQMLHTLTISFKWPRKYTSKSLDWW